MFQKWLWFSLKAVSQQKTASERQKLWHFPYGLHFGLQAKAGGHSPLAKLLITSLVLISVSEQN